MHGHRFRQISAKPIALYVLRLLNRMMHEWTAKSIVAAAGGRQNSTIKQRGK